MKAIKGESEEQSIDDLYSRQKRALIRAEAAAHQDKGEILLIIAVILQIVATLAGLIGLFLNGHPIEVVIFDNIFSIMLCIVVIVFAILAIPRKSVGYAYAAGLLGIFIGGPLLVTTVSSLISLVLAGLSERM